MLDSGRLHTVRLNIIISTPIYCIFPCGMVPPCCVSTTSQTHAVHNRRPPLKKNPANPDYKF
eukprot:scaffold20186_cov71-Cyclotella_meneghiniana.AAC.10